MFKIILKDKTFTIPKENLVFFVRSLQRAGEVKDTAQAIKYLENKKVVVEEI